MKLALRSAVRPAALLACTAALAACEAQPVPPSQEFGYINYNSVPACDSSITVAKDSPALIITDPEALASLQLEEVMTTLLSGMGDYDTTPLQLAQRLFDGTNNDAAGVFNDSYHCDTAGNPAHVNGPAADCPRSEGALAASDGLLTPGHKDHFVPVAVVNRFDLTPISGASCGEARIIYAKESGLTDPNDRVFLIFEGNVGNPGFGELEACRPVAQFWKSLEQEPNAAALGKRLHAAFFTTGIAATTGPIFTDLNLGFGTSFGGGGGASYYGGAGQIRVSEHMDDHWQLRQLVVSSTTDGHITFDPVTVGNNPLPDRFGKLDNVIVDEGQKTFAENFAYENVASLGAARVEDIRSTFHAEDLSGESALGGDAVNDYLAHATNNKYLRARIDEQIPTLSPAPDCPSDDPLTADSILRRATMDSCAGCHAPSQFLGADRKIGCGLTWPDSLGDTHIDESGNLSPALKDVFLPHRADVMQTFLQACDGDAIQVAFGGSPSSGSTTKSLDRRRTIGGSTTH